MIIHTILSFRIIGSAIGSKSYIEYMNEEQEGRRIRSSERDMPKIRAAKLVVKRPSLSGKHTVKALNLSVKRRRVLEKDVPCDFTEEGANQCLNQAEVEYQQDQRAYQQPDNFLSEHGKRKVKEANEWDKIRLDLYRTGVSEDSTPEQQLCVTCMEQNIDKIASHCCLECGPHQFFCRNCAFHLLTRRNNYRMLEEWQGGQFKPMLFSDAELRGRCFNESTCTFYRKHCIVIDYQGRQHSKKTRYCGCGTEAAQLLKLGLWPASSKKPIAFNLQFMKMASIFLLESQVSLFKFCDTMALLSSKLLPIKYSSYLADKTSAKYYAEDPKSFHNELHDQIQPYCAVDEKSSNIWKT
ncbi:uncharacterized protein LOC135683375 isoform X2 [Rhopilema esculentum]|uniref:uncharacterized protein LOC135683375 isoform X2 n=1 Tax=Rhopilema esculentum TaxID=499914 RepID=UPI0031E0DFFB